MNLKDHVPMALASTFAYEDGLTAITGSGTRLVECNVDNIQSYVALNGDKLGIIFRGTDSLKDWFYNVRIVGNRNQWCPGDDASEVDVARRLGKYSNKHFGFELMFQKIWPHIWPLVRKRYTNHKVYLCGHSLGAALAVYTGEALIRKGIPLYAIDTFAAPPLYREGWANSVLPKITTRFTNGNDILPRLLRKWEHVGQHIHLGKPVSPLRFYRGVRDHNMKLYLANLQVAAMTE